MDVAVIVLLPFPAVMITLLPLALIVVLLLPTAMIAPSELSVIVSLVLQWREL